MGVFDTMSGYVVCPHCSMVNRADIQFKWLDPMMADYTIGDYIDGNDAYSILDEDNSVCSSCKQSFHVYAIGHFGYLYGFSNDYQVEKLQPFLANEESSSNLIQLVISLELKNNPDEILRLFQESFLKNPNESCYYIGFDSHDISSYVCRINRNVSMNEKRPNTGDIVYLDNRRSRYQVWELHNEPFTIKEAVLNENTQLFSYTIESSEYRFKEINETSLVSQSERDRRIDELNSYIQTIKEMANGKKSNPFHSFQLKMHGQGLVQYLKDRGEIPPDFSFSS